MCTITQDLKSLLRISRSLKWGHLRYIYSHESIPFSINFIYKLIELNYVALVFAWVKVNENENENENILLVLAPRDVSQMRCLIWYRTWLLINIDSVCWPLVKKQSSFQYRYCSFVVFVQNYKVYTPSVVIIWC